VEFFNPTTSAIFKTELLLKPFSLKIFIAAFIIFFLVSSPFFENVFI